MEEGDEVSSREGEGVDGGDCEYAADETAGKQRTQCAEASGGSDRNDEEGNGRGGEEQGACSKKEGTKVGNVVDVERSGVLRVDARISRKM